MELYSCLGQLMLVCTFSLFAYGESDLHVYSRLLALLSLDRLVACTMSMSTEPLLQRFQNNISLNRYLFSFLYCFNELQLLVTQHQPIRHIGRYFSLGAQGSPSQGSWQRRLLLPAQASAHTHFPSSSLAVLFTFSLTVSFFRLLVIVHFYYCTSV